jgi:hypothetical protein
MIKISFSYWRSVIVLSAYTFWIATRGATSEWRELGDLVAFVSIGVGLYRTIDQDRLRAKNQVGIESPKVHVTEHESSQ